MVQIPVNLNWGLLNLYKHVIICALLLLILKIVITITNCQSCAINYLFYFYNIFCLAYSAKYFILLISLKKDKNETILKLYSFYLSLDLGVFLWNVGSIYLLVFELITSTAPYPSVADLFYLSLSPLAAFGIYSIYKIYTDDVLQDLSKISSFLILIIVNSIILILSFSPIATIKNTKDFYSFFLNIIYTFTDLLCIGLLLSIILGTTYSKMPKMIKISINFLLLGFVLNYFANLLFGLNYNVLNIEIIPYYNGSWLDICYGFIMLCFIVVIINTYDYILSQF